MPDRALHPAKKFLIGDLLGSRVIDTDGRILGHVADIQVSSRPPYEVQGLLYGGRGWMHRLHLRVSLPDEASGRRKADFIPWQAVKRLEPGVVYLKEDWQA